MSALKHHFTLELKSWKAVFSCPLWFQVCFPFGLGVVGRLLFYSYNHTQQWWRWYHIMSLMYWHTLENTSQQQGEKLNNRRSAIRSSGGYKILFSRGLTNNISIQSFQNQRAKDNWSLKCWGIKHIHRHCIFQGKQSQLSIQYKGNLHEQRSKDTVHGDK